MLIAGGILSPEVDSLSSEVGVRSASGCTPGAVENFGLERVMSLDRQLSGGGGLTPVDCVP